MTRSVPRLTVTLECGKKERKIRKPLRSDEKVFRKWLKNEIRSFHTEVISEKSDHKKAHNSNGTQSMDAFFGVRDCCNSKVRNVFANDEESLNTAVTQAIAVMRRARKKLGLGSTS